MEKCQIKMISIKHMGHILMQNSLKVLDKKVKTVVDAPPPKDASQLRSFLGLGQFCTKFVSHFSSITAASITAPLWKWEEEEQYAFVKLKRGLIEAPVMAYYNAEFPTTITSDASPIGSGAILEQQQPNGVWKPVYYFSRKLTPAES